VSKKIPFSLFLITVFISLVIINLLLIYQKRINSDFVLKFETRYKDLSLDNSILIDIILKDLEHRSINSFLLDPKLNQNKSDFNKSILVWRYFENSCNTCVEEEFLNIKKYSMSIGIDNILIMTSSNDLRELKASIHASKMGDFKLINIPDSVINYSLNEMGYENKPFYFILEPSGYAVMIFKPDIRVPQLTEKYFEMVINKYFFYK
jgi:hypothetical protein